MNAWMTQKKTTYSYQMRLQPFPPAFYHRIRVMKAVFTFSSLFPFQSLKTDKIFRYKQASFANFNVRKGTHDILKTVKLCYIYRWSHLFYMCLHLWREPESSMGCFPSTLHHFMRFICYIFWIQYIFSLLASSCEIWICLQTSGWRQSHTTRR